MTKNNHVAVLLILFMLSVWPAMPLAAQPAAGRYRIGVCDWMMLKRQKLGEFALARQVGAEGVEMDMGPLGNRVLFDNQVRQEATMRRFRHVADSVGVLVPSVAMSGFFAQNLLKRDNYLDLIDDCLHTMRDFGARVAFLPLGGSGSDWTRKGAVRKELVGRLREIGRRASVAGVVIGIRTGMDAKADARLLKEIGSDGIKIYYNLQDAVDNRRDVCKELKRLGRGRIVQIHASLTDSVTLDRDPRIDLHKVKRTLDEMQWSGWLVVERSRDVSRVRDVKYNFSTNVAYLKEIFKDDK